MGFSKGWFLKLEIEKEKELREHKCAGCIVRHPCACCLLPLILAIAGSIFGWIIVFNVNEGKEAGPLRGSEDGLTYPFRDIISRQMDALDTAVKQSEADYQAYNVNANGRMLAVTPPAERQPSWGGGRLQEFLGPLLSVDLSPPTPLPSPASPFASRAVATRRLDTDNWQTDRLVSATFIFQSRDASRSVFEEDALAEMCRLHATLTTDTTPYGKYQGYADFCERSLYNGTLQCHSGFTPLVLFYGDASYDIDTIDMSVFSTPNFTQIVSLAAEGKQSEASSTFPQYAPEVLALLRKLYAYQATWFDSPVTRPPWPGCSSALKKDTTRTLQVIAAMRADPALDAIFGSVINFYFDSEFSSTNLKSVYTRAGYYYGAPLKYGDPPFINADDRESDQENTFVDWFWKEASLQDSYDENNKDLWSVVLPTGFIPPLLLQILVDLLITDGIRAIAPLFLVFLIVWFQTRSCFIALVTVVECILSFTSAILVMAIIGVRWLAFEQFLAIYIVLAIGADDVFVFMDAYKQSFYMGPEVNSSLTMRMSRAGLAMLITSLTTCCAFIATAISSPIPTLQNFGIFTAVVIMMDYILVMTFLTASVVLYHNAFENKPALCCACCTCTEPDSKLDWWLCHPSKHGGCSSLCGSVKQTTTQLAVEGGSQTIPGAKPLYLKFFEDTFPFNVVIKNKVTRVISIVFFLALFIPAIVGTSQLEAQTSAEQFLPDSHPFQRYFTAITYFSSSREDETIEMQLVYGFDPQDPMNLDGVNRLFDPDNLGAPKFSPTFVMDAEAQQALFEDCSQLRASSLVKNIFLTETATTFALTYCWIEAFKAHRECTNQSFPVPSDASEAVLQWVETGRDVACPQTSWPSGRFVSSAISSGRFDYTGDLGWVLSEGTLKLAWTRLRAESEMIRRTYLPASTLRVTYDEWEALAASMNTNASASLGDCMQVASKSTTTRDNKWLHMLLQETYVRMALTGVMVGLLIALAVLLAATRNLIVAFLSVTTIACALCCVFGLIVARGWQLGSAESLSMMTLTGFAVDYVVHLSHSYMESRQEQPLERVHDALRDLGISVFWGMLTSVIAALTLSTLQLQFFSKFGIFFLYTIVCSYLWAILFLMPLLAIVGPFGAGEHALGAGRTSVLASPNTQEKPSVYSA